MGTSLNLQGMIVPEVMKNLKITDDYFFNLRIYLYIILFCKDQQ